MGLVRDLLPFLEGWKFDNVEQGAAQGQAPFPLTAQKALKERTEGRGYLLAAIAVTNDPHATLSIKTDGEEIKFNIAELAFGGIVQNAGGTFNAPMMGRPYGPFGQAYVIQYQGQGGEWLPYKENVEVVLRASTYTPTPVLISWLVSLVQVVNPPLFVQSLRDILNDGVAIPKRLYPKGTQPPGGS